MAALRGERFHIDLSDDEDAQSSIPAKADLQSINSVFGSLVGDVRERASTAAAKPPSAPSLSDRTAPNGFPAHRKRAGVSRFKAARARDAAQSDSLQPAEDGSAAQISQTSTVGAGSKSLEEERRTIDDENKKRLAAMTPAQIESERKEIMSSLSPGLLKRFLARASIDDDMGSEDFPSSGLVPPTEFIQDQEPKRSSRDSAKPKKSVTFADTAASQSNRRRDSEANVETSDEKNLAADFSNSKNDPESPSPAEKDTDAEAIPTLPSLSHETTHFPRPPQPVPDLDPDSPDFLTELHKKYFASLPTDPSKLSWMTDTSSATRDEDGEYAAGPTGRIDVDQLRFDFAGRLLPPSVAADVPVTKGLHHHASSPSSAGYTVPELAHLSRSSVAAQRCVAYQTLGRLLYRLGIGEFGGQDEADEAADQADQPQQSDDTAPDKYADLRVRRGAGSPLLAAGLWECLRNGRVLETLQHEAAGRGRGHASARAYATEALWLWQRGGGQVLRAE